MMASYTQQSIRQHPFEKTTSATRNITMNFRKIQFPFRNRAESRHLCTETRFRCFDERRNVVIAVDASEDSFHAVHYALTNIYRADDQLIFLHVVPEFLSRPPSGSLYYPQPQDAEKTLWKQAEEFIEENFVNLARQHSAKCDVVLVKESRQGLGAAVCMKAEELNASPLVLAVHDNRNFLEKMFYSSISKHCASRFVI